MLEPYIVRLIVNDRPREALWRPRETTEASFRTQILAWPTESIPLTTPPGPLDLRVYVDNEGYNSNI